MSLRGEKEHINHLKKMVDFSSIETHGVALPKLIIDSSKNQKEYYDILGAGAKIKVLESLSAGIPVLTNAVGIEGIQAKDGEEFFHCVTEEDYEKCIRRILDGEIDMENVGFAGGNNMGIQRALEEGADYICILNNDVLDRLQ